MIYCKKTIKGVHSMKTKAIKCLLALLAILLVGFFIAKGRTAPDYTDFPDANALLSALELTEADLLPSPGSSLAFRAVDPGKSSTYHLTFTDTDLSSESFSFWVEKLRDKTKALDMDGYCRVVHNTDGAKDEEPYDSHHRWYIAYSAEKSVKYLAYQTDSGAFALKIQFAW